jgi:hypothetical protein
MYATDTLTLRAHTYETTRDIVGLGDPIERFLANTGRRDRGWDGSKLQNARHT